MALVKVIKKATTKTLEEHKATLIELAKSTGVTLTFFDDHSCVNGDCHGAFIWTSCEESLEDNIMYVTNWIADLFYNNAKLQRLMEDIDTDPELCDVFYSYYDTNINELEAQWEFEEKQKSIFKHHCAIADPYLDDCYLDLRKETTRIHS